MTEADLAAGDMLDCWLYWLLHAQEYEHAALLELLPQPAIRQATETLGTISQQSEDKAMYDAREKAIRDRNWQLNAARREGEIKGEIEGEIELIRTPRSQPRPWDLVGSETQPTTFHCTPRIESGAAGPALELGPPSAAFGNDMGLLTPAGSSGR